jgi:hypothetical protein
MKLEKKDIVDLVILQMSGGNCVVPHFIHCDKCVLGRFRTNACSGFLFDRKFADDTLKLINALLEKIDPLELFECQLLAI